MYTGCRDYNGYNLAMVIDPILRSCLEDRYVGQAFNIRPIYPVICLIYFVL